MDKDIKRLLMLSSIPGFKLSEKELKKLEDWKKAQEPVKPKKKTRSKARKTASKAVVKSETIKVSNEVEKVQNVITKDDMTLNEVES